MACCCKNRRSNKSSLSCLGRCDLPKHRCLLRSDVKPGPVPRYMGWLYTAKNSPEHQLRCGWRPGHISCDVLRRIEQHYCMKTPCAICPSACSRFPCSKPCCSPPLKCTPLSRCLPLRCTPLSKCFPPPRCTTLPRCSPLPRCAPLPRCVPISCASTTSSCCKASPCGQPLIRIIRHGGQYTIATEPSHISNSPFGPYPLKYVLNTDDDDNSGKAKYSVEAKFNDYHFDYASSQSSFVLDFSPPEQRCYKPCPKKSIICMPC